MTWKLEPGDASSYVKGEGWVDVFVDESDSADAKFIGFRQIQGARFGVFRIGRRTVAQLAQNLVPVTERMVGRARSSGGGRIKRRVDDFVFVVTIKGPRGGRRKTERSFSEYRPGSDWAEAKLKGHPGSWADVYRARNWGGVEQLQGPIGRLEANDYGHVQRCSITEPRSVGRATRRGAFDPSCHVKHRVTRASHKVKHIVACGAARHVGAEAGAAAARKVRYVVIIRHDRSAKGEYDAGHSLVEARRKAKQFVAYVSPSAEVEIAKLVTVRSGVRKGDIVPVGVETVRRPDWQARAVGRRKR